MVVEFIHSIAAWRVYQLIAALQLRVHLRFFYLSTNPPIDLPIYLSFFAWRHSHCGGYHENLVDRVDDQSNHVGLVPFQRSTPMLMGGGLFFLA